MPQGSNLSPLLFSLFINDVATILQRGTRLLFADDVKIFRIIACLGDCLELQKLLDAFSDWSNRNLLTLCVEKGNVITFSKKLQSICFPYSLSSQALHCVSQVKYSGVILDSQLTLRALRRCHFKSQRAAGIYFSNCRWIPQCTAHESFELHPSCQAIATWCPFNKVWIDRMKAVQKKFMRMALRHLP